MGYSELVQRLFEKVAFFLVDPPPMPDSHHFGAFDFVGVAAIALVDLNPRSPGSGKCLKKMLKVLRGGEGEKGHG